MLYEVRCLKSDADMIRALAGQFKQLSHESEKKFRFMRQLLKLSRKCEYHIAIYYRTAYYTGKSHYYDFSPRLLVYSSASMACF